MKAPDQLIDLAAAVSDGAAIQWEPLESETDRAQVTVVHQLRILEQIASVHARLPLARFEHSLRDASSPPDLAPERSATIPARWGPLLIIKKIGSGTYADVYLARDPRLDRPVALKLLRQHDAANRSDLDTIEEARLLARVRHPNVVTVYGAERIEGRTGIWMEYVDGRTLEQELQERGAFDAHTLVDTGTALAGALGAVHSAGLLHRDVKTQNVMRDRAGRVCLTDFGTGRETALAASRELAGTPLYLAPEVLHGEPASIASDVYSLGVLLYHLATRAFPVSGRSIRDLTDAHVRGARTSVREARPDLPADVAAVIDRAAHGDPASRYASAGALEDALRATMPAPVTPESSTSRSVKALMAVAAVTVVVTLVVATRAVTNLYSGQRASSPVAAHGAADQPVMRKVMTPLMGLMQAGTPSFYGHLYSNTDLNEDLLMFDLTSGVARKLTDKGKADEYAGFSAMSPDGHQIAYSWQRTDGRSDLRIVNADIARPVQGRDGAAPRVLVPPGRAEQIVPVEWSRDGSLLLCRLEQEGGRFQIALVSVTDGALRIVRDLAGVRPQHMTLSADARFLAYDFPAAGSEQQRDILIQPIDGSPPHAIVEHAADDSSPVWTPDGRHLFFLSNRSGTYDGWIVEVADGVALGAPAAVVRNIGQVSIAGFTSDGALYYWRRSGDMDVFTREIEPGPAGRPEQVPSRLVGSNSGPAWSPDGRFLAYISRRGLGGPAPQGVLVIHPLAAGQDREIPIRLRAISPTVLRWSPEGREILVGGVDSTGRKGVFVLHVDNGAIEPAIVAPESAPIELHGARWWIDGRSIAWASDKHIAVREGGSDRDRVIFDVAAERPAARIEKFDISPDRRSLAVQAVIDGADPMVRVLLVTTIGGTPSELLRVTAPDFIALQAWMPDSRELLFTRRDIRVRGPHALWSIALDGTSRDIGIKIPGFTHVNPVQLDPGGTRIAYTADQVTWELWAVEHFLPEAAR